MLEWLVSLYFMVVTHFDFHFLRIKKSLISITAENESINWVLMKFYVFGFESKLITNILVIITQSLLMKWVEVYEALHNLSNIGYRYNQ